MELGCEILHENVYYFPGAIKDIDKVMQTLDEVNSVSVTPWEIWYANNDSKENPYGDLKTLNFLSRRFYRKLPRIKKNKSASFSFRICVRKINPMKI